MSNHESPSEFFYGAYELSKLSHNIGYFEVDLDWEPGIFGGVINILGQRGLCPEKLTGSSLIQTKLILKQLLEYDVVVATTSGIGYALCLWKFFLKKLPPVVTIHCGLLNNQYNSLRRYFSSVLLKNSKSILFGEGELGPITDLFGLKKEQIVVNQFGIDTTFWFPAKERTGQYILSVGNDGRRDFDTLVRVAKDIPVEIRILTSRTLPDGLPSNVLRIKSSWHDEMVSDSDLRSLYQNARCVVIPLIDSYQPSGQSVALQAMACGCPVILTKTRGLWSKEWLIDGQNILFVPPGDADTVAKMTKLLVENNELNERLSVNGRLLTTEKANIASFAREIERICASIIS